MHTLLIAVLVVFQSHWLYDRMRSYGQCGRLAVESGSSAELSYPGRVTWDSYAEGWDEDAGVRAYAQAAFECLARLCAERSASVVGARTCDFGCGTGFLTEKLATVCAGVVALDTSTEMMDRLRRKIDQLGLTNVHTTTETIEYAVRHDKAIFGIPFDVVVCSSVCAFLDDYAATTRTLVRLLRPGGLFVQWDWEVDPHVPDSFGLAREDVNATLLGAGLEAVHVTSAFEVSLGDETVRPLVGVGQVPSRDQDGAPE